MNQSAPPSPAAVPAGMALVYDLVRAGKKIEAIKQYRELTGQGLRESKDAIDALEREMRR